MHNRQHFYLPLALLLAALLPLALTSAAIADSSGAQVAIDLEVDEGHTADDEHGYLAHATAASTTRNDRNSLDSSEGACLTHIAGATNSRSPPANCLLL